MLLLFIHPFSSLWWLEGWLFITNRWEKCQSWPLLVAFIMAAVCAKWKPACQCCVRVSQKKGSFSSMGKIACFSVHENPDITSWCIDKCCILLWPGFAFVYDLSRELVLTLPSMQSRWHATCPRTRSPFSIRCGGLWFRPPSSTQSWSWSQSTLWYSWWRSVCPCSIQSILMNS